MGLTTWRNVPKGKVRKSDITVAKNYLSEKELKQLNRIVTMYLDYAELQAESQKVMSMKDWISKLDAFIRFNEREVLTNPGKVSAEVAKSLAKNEYGKYKEELKKIEATQPVSDFDKLVEKTKTIEHKNPRKKTTKEPKRKK